MTDLLTVAVLCTGNRFRSPLAAAVFVRESAGVMPVDVFSLGTLHVDGLPALREAIPIAARYGVDLTDHLARQLERGELASVELVLGFEKFHVAAAVVDGGASRASVYTLPELVALLEELDAGDAPTPLERARHLLAAAATARGGIGRPPQIADPFGEPHPRQEAIAAEVVDLTERLVSLLVGR